MCIRLTQTSTFPEDDLGIYTSAELLAPSSLYVLFSFHGQKIIKKKRSEKTWKAKAQPH